jgi:hypothetical protein
MPDKTQLGAEQDFTNETENTGPVLFSKIGVSPVPIKDFDPVGKPVSELLKHLEKTQGLEWDGMQISILRNGSQDRVDDTAIVRPGDYVQIAEAIANN